MYGRRSSCCGKDKVKEAADDATGGAVSDLEDAKEDLEDAVDDAKDVDEALKKEEKEDDD